MMEFDDMPIRLFASIDSLALWLLTADIEHEVDRLASDFGLATSPIVRIEVREFCNGEMVAVTPLRSWGAKYQAVDK